MRYRIVPKRDFGSGKGYYDRGRWIKSGFVVTFDEGEYRGCNAMPGATWFETIPQAFIGINVLEACRAFGGGTEAFWRTLRKRLADAA